MSTVSMREAKNKLTELARRVEGGETVVVTRHGKPAFEMVPAKAQKEGINWDAIEQIKKERGLTTLVSYIAEDFDDPLPEDFLLHPLPPD